MAAGGVHKICWSFKVSVAGVGIFSLNYVVLFAQMQFSKSLEMLDIWTNLNFEDNNRAGVSISVYLILSWLMTAYNSTDYPQIDWWL